MALRITPTPILLLAATALSGCVLPPPPAAYAPQQVQYVAVPGPGRTEAQFHAEDLLCRAAAAQLPPGPGVVVPSSTGTGTGTATGAVVVDPALQEPPGVTYFRCMAAHGNQIQPLPQVAPPLYAAYAAYPVYVGGYGDYYPWLYGPGYFGGGFYGGYGFGFGYRGGYGFRGGYGYGGYGGGFRGGFGYGGGFGGGFRGGFRR